MENEMVLKVKNLKVDIINKKPIVKGISFNVRKGKVFGLIGESGSGKSITCKSILGLLNRDRFRIRGEVYLNNREIININEEKKSQIRGQDISIIMQNPMTAFNPLIKIGNHFIETLRIHKNITKKEAYNIAVEYLEKMKLSRKHEIMNSYSWQLSGGMLQRIMIAIAISMNPTLLIADEPTTALDVTTQFKILSEIDRVKREYNTAVIFVSHDFDVIAQMADEVGVMYNGEIVEYGPVMKIFDDPEHPYTKGLLQSRVTV